MTEAHSTAGSPDESAVLPPLLARRVHRIKLRDRLRIAGLRGDAESAEQLCKALLRQPGIERVRFNPAAASLTISYSEEFAQRQLAETLASLDAFEIRLHDVAGDPGTSQSPARSRSEPAARPAAADNPEAAAAHGDEGWHLQELAAVLEALQSQPEGLSPAEATRRLRQHGPNLLARLERRSDWHILREQFQSAPVAMLGVSAAISLLTAAPLDATVIAIVIGTNAAIGFLTERQAEDTIASMASIEGQELKVLRDGSITQIDASEVVRGDILLLEPGARLPADARLVRAHHLTVDESSLTGESLPVIKKARNCDEPRVLAERRNMVHLGTVVSGGDGRAVVVETGDDTELGRIQSLASASQRPMTPMQEQLNTVSTQLAVMSSAVCALVFAVGLARGQPRLAMLNTAISLAVAAVPEGLPAISNSLLAIGIRRMREQNVLARHLDAIENLGAIDVLCVDKTGTLTENRMRVMEARSPQQRVDFSLQQGDWREQAEAIDERFWKVLALCNESQEVEGEWQGSPTENALVEAAANAGIKVTALRKSMPRKRVRYRSEKRPYMVSAHSYPRKKSYFHAVKGRPRQVITACTHMRKGNRRVALSDKMREQIMAENRALMDESYRVLGVAWKHQDEASIGKTDGLEWLGLVAMADPLRPEVADLLPGLQQAGIRTIILTGDQLGTARAIGRKARLNGDGDVRVLGADELEQLSEGELLEEVKQTHVFARVSPAMKLKLVQGAAEKRTPGGHGQGRHK